MPTNADIARSIVSRLEDRHSYGYPELHGPITAALDAAAASERERCAKIADEEADFWRRNDYEPEASVASDIAAKIRQSQ